LNWHAESEGDNEVFVIERSRDRIVWREIGVVSGMEKTMDGRSYAYNDAVDGSLPVSVQLFYRLRRIHGDGSNEYSRIVPVRVAALPSGVALHEAYPNPFTQNTRIAFTLDTQSPVALAICDPSGREVAKLLENAFLEAGIHSVEFRANDLPGGMYTVVLRAGSSIRHQRILLHR